MSDEKPPVKKRNELAILLGIVGAVAGYFGTLVLLNLPASHTSGDAVIGAALIVLFVVCPIGAIVGLLIGVWIGRNLRGGEKAAGESTTKTAVKTLAIVLTATVIGVGAYAIYEFSIATPWLRPGNVRLQFEVRLPPGAAVPPEQDVKAELQTDLNTMPADMKPDQLRSDDGRPVIVGAVWLHYRTSIRQLAVKVPGRMESTYPIKIPARAPHSATLGAWQPHPDGSEIRYRAQWPGED